MQVVLTKTKNNKILSITAAQVKPGIGETIRFSGPVNVEIISDDEFMRRYDVAIQPIGWQTFGPEHMRES